ncbi:DUF3667 domain-containing protein [Aridibaculum aurantiacum]|uniref:DUF3667 domain-containing protein n=1 Tax=Aridibaculum aurantiacum TaxID=2810307 RepID=UPI001A97536A|nr:DUF3667 domain-containing protein [Aridibaculum aurantiacum]
MENYCSRCGQPYQTKQITLHGLLHEVFHLFTHLDKGFGYTLKQLLTAPGHMQRRYIEGDRFRHQKPFSTFFICATIAALSRYWIFKALYKYYNIGSITEATFFHEYMVLLHIVLLPIYALIAYLFFYRSKYNYAEMGILVLYTVSFFFVAATAISLIKFIWPKLDTAYIELPVLLCYNVITFVNFFNHLPRWKVMLKSLLIVCSMFLLAQLAEDYVVEIIR